MIKTYPENIVQKQLIVTSTDFNLESEIIFTIINKCIIIDYLGMHIKIAKNEIRKVEIKKNDTNYLTKIFFSINQKIQMEYIFFSSKNKIKDIYDFFEDFNLIK